MVTRSQVRKVPRKKRPVPKGLGVLSKCKALTREISVKPEGEVWRGSRQGGEEERGEKGAQFPAGGADG